MRVCVHAHHVEDPNFQKVGGGGGKGVDLRKGKQDNPYDTLGVGRTLGGRVGR
jgi:hypothetical protein